MIEQPRGPKLRGDFTAVVVLGDSVRSKAMLEVHDVPTVRCPVVILNALGLHLRPASRFVGLAQRFASEIRVYCEDREADGKSLLDLATLSAECGTRLELEARGPDAEAALEALAGLISAGFHEADDG